MLKPLFYLLFILAFTVTHAQGEEQNETSNIQNYTPSKLLENGKWDVKWFNNLYTQTKADVNGTTIDVPRSNFFTTSLEVFTGVSESKKFNAGFIIEYRSNTFGNQSATSPLSFNNEIGKSRTGLSHIAPSVKIAPFSSLPNFSMQSSIFIPLFSKESDQNGYLANNSYIWQNRFFYDYSFPGSKFQLFSELGTRLFFGEKNKNSDGTINPNGGYANSSVELAPGIFLSYFPSSKFTTLVFAQHAQLIEIDNKFSQNYTALGLGAKYQLSKSLNVETLYSKFIRGNDSGLGQSFNLGLRAIF
ncbi:hypothetical protein SAMN05443667_10756 [Flavobacterium gillisiae]|uniref:MetA-pathway of phenol degradation n=1 Tax=Flavobacterium gillisiae TaxID=150146 RepID=A0A1H4D622_9FLAO|nr:hypothetical protein [Flavobacterium gillisiae]SEA67742.1 hypothetical protein SAMN05443667_10756 [Flavobacterium gillisiae]